MPPLPGLTWTMGTRLARQRTSLPAAQGDSLACIGPLIKTLMTPRPPEVLTTKERFLQTQQWGNDPETAASAPGPSAALLEAMMMGPAVGSGAIKPAGHSSPTPQDWLHSRLPASRSVRGLRVHRGLGLPRWGSGRRGPGPLSGRRTCVLSEHPGGLTEGAGFGGSD